MKFGVCVPNYGETLSLESLLQVATEAENLGYDSLWTTDHILMPRGSGTPYEKIFDCIATLCYLAPQTRKVKLGISSLIIAMRNPAVVAKQIASLDRFSQGRIMIAIAAGWNETEFSYVGSDFHNRGRKVDESIKLMRALWKGETSFHGDTINFDHAVFEPAPLSKDVEIWVGGISHAAMKRAANLGDAWHPTVMPLEKFKEAVSDFRGMSKKPIRVRIGLSLNAKESETTGPQGDKRLILTGDMKQNRNVVQSLENLGIDCCILAINSDGKVEPKDQLESLHAFASEFI